MRFHRFHAVAAALLICCASLGCGPRKTPIPVPPPSRAPSPPSQPTPSGTPLPSPELQASVAPSRIQPGESALLTWETRHASGVSIVPGIGQVDGAGQLRLYPDLTTTYQLTALGPGGTARRNVTVEVGGLAEAPVRAEDIRPDPSLPLEERFRQAVQPIFFEFDKAKLSLEALRVLDANAAWLAHPDNQGFQFIIQGHCDLRGTDEYNLALGDLRAQVARQHLVSKGVGPARIITVSLGEERPFEWGDTEEAHALNRRAHFVLLNR
ncbi:MAG: OmpA family protein [Acidobacteriota bacterium]